MMRMRPFSDLSRNRTSRFHKIIRGKKLLNRTRTPYLCLQDLIKIELT
jgi:hypothetical protein